MTVEYLDGDVLELDDPLMKISKLLVKYELTSNQVKVYLYLSKTGSKTASEISKSLIIPRTETYHLLSSLHQKGIVFSIYGKPTKFDAVEIDKSIAILVQNQKNRINELESIKERIVKLWNSIPKYA
jgi:sugar-specific transcriptional regulator TrmB